MVEEREVVLGSGPGRRRALSLAAVGVVLAAVGFVYARTGGAANVGSPSTTAVADPPSTAGAETSAPAGTDASAIAPAPATAVTSTAVPQGSAIAGRLPSAISRRPGVLWTLSRSAGDDVVLTRVDLQAGATLQWQLAHDEAGGPLGRDLVPFADGAVVIDDHRLTWFPATGGRPIELTFARPGAKLLRFGGSEAWLVGQFDRIVLRASLTGEFVIKSAGFMLPEGFVAVSALPDGSIVGWSLFGGTYRVDRRGAVSRLSTATLTIAGADGRHGVGLDCDASLRCGAVRLDLVTGASAPSPLTAADPFGWAVSPDGRWLAVAEGQPSLANLITGEVVRLDLASDPLWVGFSTDGRWCLVVTDTRLRSVSLAAPGSAAVESIDLGFVGRVERAAVGPESGS